MTLQAVRTAVETPIIEALSAGVSYLLQEDGSFICLEDGVTKLSAEGSGAGLDIPTFVENQLYAENDALTEFALVRLQFGEVTEPAVGCPPGENLRASLVVELFTPKGRGPGRAQQAMTAVMQVLAGFGGLSSGTADTRVTVNRIVGPTFTPLDGRPHLMARLSAGLRFRYDGA